MVAESPRSSMYRPRACVHRQRKWADGHHSVSCAHDSCDTPCPPCCVVRWQLAKSRPSGRSGWASRFQGQQQAVYEETYVCGAEHVHTDPPSPTAELICPVGSGSGCCTPSRLPTHSHAHGAGYAGPRVPRFRCILPRVSAHAYLVHRSDSKCC